MNVKNSSIYLVDTKDGTKEIAQSDHNLLEKNFMQEDIEIKIENFGELSWI